LLAKHNAKQLRYFKLNQEKKDDKLLILPPSKVFWRVLSSHPVEYKKNWHDNSITLIFKKGEFDSFQWRIESAEQLKEARRLGIIKTHSVTGQVIAALGQYRLGALERVKNGLVSNRYSLKEMLVTHYQDRFEALQEIESLVNSNVGQKKLQEALDAHVKAYKDKLTLLNKALGATANQAFLKVDPNGVRCMQEELESDIKHVEKFLSNSKEKSFQQATGINSVLTFVKTQMIRNLRQLQNHNQNITYSRKMSFAMTRGDLNSCIEDAEKIIEDYIAWPHDTVAADHQGRYENEQGMIFDSAYHCSSAEEEQRALLAITFIEKENTLDLSDDEDPKVLTTTGNVSLDKIKATKWQVGGGWLRVIASTLAWFANIAIKLVVGIVEVPLTLFIEPLTFGHLKRFFNGVREIATYEIPVKNSRAPQLVKQELLDETRRKPKTLGLRIRHFAVVAFKNTFEDMFYGVRDVYKQFSIHLFDSILNDANDALSEKDKPTLDGVIDDSKREITKITQDIQEL
jgi:hypothetical protein